MPDISNEGWYTYAKERGIAKGKAQEYWDIAKKEGGENWKKVFGIFKKIIDNSKKNESIQESTYPIYDIAINYLEDLAQKPVNRKTYNELLELEQELELISVKNNNIKELSDLAEYISAIHFLLKSEINTKKKLNLGNDSMQNIINRVNNIRKYKKQNIYVERTIGESMMSRLQYMNVEEADDNKDGIEDYLVPFLGYAENNGVSDKDQAKAIFFRVQGSVAKKQGKDKDKLSGEDMGILWAEFKDAIANTKGKKESVTLSKAVIVEGVYIKKDSIINLL